MYRALKTSETSLLPKKFIVYYGHQYLKHFHVHKHADKMLSKWAVYLQQFNYSIVQKSGDINQVVDALSRQATRYHDYISSRF